MRLLVPAEVRKRMCRHLTSAGKREIGGILMGEGLGDQAFRIINFTVDDNSGTRSSFFRHSEQHDKELSEFFEKTEFNYQRYNYLGEWHSHPSF